MNKIEKLVVLPLLVLIGFCIRSISLYGATSQVIMKDGRILTGAISPMRSVAEMAGDKKKESGIQSEKILLIDDQLRRIYIPKNSVRDILPDELTPSYEIFRLPQRPDLNPAHQIITLGPYRSTTAFDSFGRRTIMVGGQPIVQGISEIAPHYVRVPSMNYNLDMRISPHSIPRKILSSLIRKNIRQDSLDDRLRIYQYYVQAELYEQAAEELQEIITDFEGKGAGEDRLKIGLQMIRQLAAKRLLEELDLRRQAGQYRKVKDLLLTFESQGISQEKIQAVRRMLLKYEEEGKQKQHIISSLQGAFEKIADKDQKEALAPLVKEIAVQLNQNTLERFSEYLLALQDPALNDPARLAVGLSGWLAGNMGTDNRLEIALSMYRIRQLTRKYFLEKIPEERENLWKTIQKEEAATPERIARIIYLMKPPKSTPRSAQKTPAFYELETPSFLPDQSFKYYVQLPPEYDPNRTYPTILTLHGERSTAPMQIDWWCGPWTERKGSGDKPVYERFGQATRHGYIVIAPVWNESGAAYDYSARAHAAVLYSLRDAMKRFAIDSDRVFLSGHSSGGDAAWDLGLSHPDLWAGIIPVCGTAAKYSTVLKKNAQYVSVYAIGGEWDGGSLLKSSEVLDCGMDLSKPFDMSFVQYRGRGREAFPDELIRIFEWMQLRTRQGMNKEEKTVYSLRPWDNFFWSAELSLFPNDLMIDPTFWIRAETKGIKPAKTEFFRVAGNSVKIKSSAKSARIFLSPDLVDFNQRIEVMFNMKKISPGNGIILPNIKVILDDVRTRGDRKHPFWAVL
ncbi:MAG: hypothetical protein Q4G69_11035 [Planctomycetia bacterium]|nr:hypothetical protein [Planctomycetia bacterium]